MTRCAHPLLIDYVHQQFIHTMASPSEYSSVDNDRFLARSQYIMQEPSAEPETHERAEADFAGFGGQFGDRRSSYPHQVELSEEEEAVRQPRSTFQAEPFLSSSPGTVDRPALGGPPLTSDPNQHQDARLVHVDHLPQTRSIIRRGRRHRRRSDGTLLFLFFTQRRAPSFLVHGSSLPRSARS